MLHIHLACGTRGDEYALVEIPETRYAETSDGAYIAFQVFGSGPVDLLLMPGFFTNLDENWRIPEIADTHRLIGSFARVVAMDRRGVGLSDRFSPGKAEPLETHVDDLIAVLDAAKVQDACIFSSESGAPLALLFAAAHPERTRALALFVPFPCEPGRLAGTEDEETLRQTRLEWVRGWGDGVAREDLEGWNPTMAGDPAMVKAWGAYLRSAASPGSALALEEQSWHVDVRGIYPSVRVPTLIMERSRVANWAKFRPLVHEAAAKIPGAKLVNLAGRDALYWWGDREEFAAHLEEFFVGTRSATAADARRGLATVLFTDIVGSTRKAAELGDTPWKSLLERHHRTVRAMIGRYRGIEVDTAGDGFFAAFDGPARGVRCAQAIIEAVQPLGVEIRAGLHTGEVETINQKAGGIAVHIGARVGALAGPSQVVVSSTVKDLTAGSGLVFEDAGEHELKGVPDRWHLFRVMSGQP
nr:adenylate/guanylate cyclase domain-containing protein [Actinomycetota bacterium]